MPVGRFERVGVGTEQGCGVADPPASWRRAA